MIREFLKNRAENLLSAHFGLQNFAASIVNIFFGVYLYQIGIPLWEIFLIWGITFFTRCLLRPVVLPLYFRYGVRRMLIIGIICNAISFLALERVTEVGIWLGIFMLLVAITDIFYWTAFHLYFALLGENMRRGKQVAIRNCMEFLSSFLAPLVSAILIVKINFSAIFWVGAGFLFLSGIPLFFVPDVELPEPQKFFPAVKIIEKSGFWLFFMDAIFSQAHGFTWTLVLFIFVGKYLTFGGLLSLAVLFQMIAALFLGQRFDRGNGKKLVPLGVILLTLTVFGRVFMTASIPAIIFFDVLFILGFLLLYPFYLATFYNAVKSSRHPLYFQVVAESGWDMGSVIITGFASVFLYLGGDLKYIMLFGIFGLFGVAFVLKRYFLQHSEKTSDLIL